MLDSVIKTILTWGAHTYSQEASFRIPALLPPGRVQANSLLFLCHLSCLKILPMASDLQLMPAEGWPIWDEPPWPNTGKEAWFLSLRTASECPSACSNPFLTSLASIIVQVSQGRTVLGPPLGLLQRSSASLPWVQAHYVLLFQLVFLLCVFGVNLAPSFEPGVVKRFPLEFQKSLEISCFVPASGSEQ